MKNKTLSSKNIIEGKWWKITDNVHKIINAKYDKIKDWKIDPKGYFLIKLDKKNKLIRVAYCKFSSLKKNALHEMIAEINGTSAIEIINTLINYKFISSLQHAGDMGIELNKAEIALKHNLNYDQDKDLKF